MQKKLKSKATVDGRNPEPVDIGSLSYYLKGFINSRWCRIFSIKRYALKTYEQSGQASHKKGCSSAEVKCVLHSAEGFKEPKRQKTKTLEKVYLNDCFKDDFSPFQMSKMTSKYLLRYGSKYLLRRLHPNNVGTWKHASSQNRVLFRASLFRCESLHSLKLAVRTCHSNHLFWGASC